MHRTATHRRASAKLPSRGSSLARGKITFCAYGFGRHRFSRLLAGKTRRVCRSGVLRPAAAGRGRGAEAAARNRPARARQLLSDIARTQPWLRNRARGLRLGYCQLGASIAPLDGSPARAGRAAGLCPTAGIPRGMAPCDRQVTHTWPGRADPRQLCASNGPLWEPSIAANPSADLSSFKFSPSK